ncbi:MAG: helix-turn-helix transcriptional regulator [Myxococcota bacterium]
MGLSDSESEFIEMKLALAENLKQRRIQRGMTQKDSAERLSSSQSRVAKIEGETSRSAWICCLSLLTVGLTRREIAKVIAGAAPPRRFLIRHVHPVPLQEIVDQPLRDRDLPGEEARHRLRRIPIGLEDLLAVDLDLAALVFRAAAEHQGVREDGPGLAREVLHLVDDDLGLLEDLALDRVRRSPGSTKPASTLLMPGGFAPRASR